MKDFFFGILIGIMFCTALNIYFIKYKCNVCHSTDTSELPMGDYPSWK